MSKGLKYFALHSAKKKRCNISAENYIHNIFIKLNAEKCHVKNVLDLYDKIKFKSTIFNRSNPQSIASGLCYYYINNLDIEHIDISVFCEITGLSEMTIQKITNIIEEIVNDVGKNDFSCDAIEV